MYEFQQMTTKTTSKNILYVHQKATILPATCRGNFPYQNVSFFMNEQCGSLPNMKQRLLPQLPIEEAN